MSSHERIILITGATSGIGCYLSHHFVRSGNVVIAHGRNSDKLASLCSGLQDGTVVEAIADLTQPAEIREMFATIANRFSHIDVLINNAFGQLMDPLMDADSADIPTFFQTSLAGTAEIIRCAVPLLQQSPLPRIINIVADWGIPMHNVMTGPSLYIAAKYGVHGLGVALQTELAPYGIRTTNVCPGIVAADTAPDLTDEEFVGKHGASAIHPQSIADAIDFVIGQQFAHIRSIVLTPTDAAYNGLEGTT